MAAQARLLADALPNTFPFIVVTPGSRQATHQRQKSSNTEIHSKKWMWRLKAIWKGRKERVEARATLWQPRRYF